MDSSAAIYAKSEKEIIFGGCYGEDLQEGQGTTLHDVTPEGLFNLFKDGVHPGEKYWHEHLEGFESEEEEN